MRRPLLFLALLLFVPAVLAACSDDSTSGDDAGDSTSTSEPDAEPDRDTDGTTGPDADSDDESPSASGSSGDFAEFCGQVDSLEEVEDPTDPEYQAAVEDLIDQAPDEIKDDLQTVLDTVLDFGSFDDEDPQAFIDALALMEDPAFIEAAENLEAFGVTECGFEPSDVGTTE
jgi:hypothetical protein